MTHPAVKANQMVPNAMFMSLVTLAALCIVWFLTHLYLKGRRVT